MLIVEMMRHGRTPQEACEAMIARVNTVATRRGVRPAEIGVLAMSADGEIGAACTEPTDFVLPSVALARCPSKRVEGRAIARDDSAAQVGSERKKAT